MSKHPILPGHLRSILVVTLVHAIAWFTYFGQIPIGQYSGPEESASIQAALAQTHDLPVSLYQGILNCLAKLAHSPHALTLAARGLNVLALLLATGMCAAAAGHFWMRSRAVWITGLLFGLNPVLVFWAGEAAPSILATACMAFALWALLRWIRKPRPSDSLLIGLALALGGAFQPVLLALAASWPLLALIYPNRSRPLHFGSALLFPALLSGLLLVSALQLQYPIQINASEFGQKLYAFFNNSEPYDGKTFALHKRLNLPLFLNPIHWGLLLILASGGCYVHLKNGRHGYHLLAFLWILSLSALAYILTDGSSRARLPLLPMLAIFASGAAWIPHMWRLAGPQTKRKIVIAALAIGALTYSSFWGLGSTTSWAKDYAFMAEANSALGHNQAATTWARKTLKLNPDCEQMHQVLVQAEFNDWALGLNPKPLAVETTRQYLQHTRATKSETIPQPANISVIEAIYLWKLHQNEPAVANWQAHASQNALALICLYWTGHAAKPAPEIIATYQSDPNFELLQAAVDVDRTAVNYGAIEKLVDNLIAAAH